MPDLTPADEPIIREINETYNKCRRASFEALSLAIRCGDLLIEVKGKVPHGDWLSWVDKNLVIGHRQAQKLMRLATNRDKIDTNANSPTHLTIEGALKSLRKRQAISPKENATNRLAQAALSRDLDAIFSGTTDSRLDLAITEICNINKPAREICRHISEQSERAELLMRTERARAYLGDLETTLRESLNPERAKVLTLVSDDPLEDG
ncbi:MAG: DUF3102 domain-containing protein [Rhodospirillales bacterium]